MAECEDDLFYFTTVFRCAQRSTTGERLFCSVGNKTTRRRLWAFALKRAPPARWYLARGSGAGDPGPASPLSKKEIDMTELFVFGVVWAGCVRAEGALC